jgi:hypothetical protein
MTTLIQDVAKVLTDAGYSENSIKAYSFDESSSDQIVINEYPGQAPIMSVDSATRRPGITIMVRDAVLATAESRALAIWSLFACSKTLTNHQAIQATNSGYSHDIDENGRHIFVVSFYVFG